MSTINVGVMVVWGYEFSLMAAISIFLTIVISDDYRCKLMIISIANYDI